MAISDQICKGRLQESMRQRLLAGGLEDHVDDPEVDPNFLAMGRAINQILTLDADPTSDAAADAAFWAWIAAVSTWMTAMRNWQTGVVGAVNTWNPTGPDIALKTTIMNLAQPPAPPAPPASMKVDIR